ASWSVTSSPPSPATPPPSRPTSPARSRPTASAPSSLSASSAAASRGKWRSGSVSVLRADGERTAAVPHLAEVGDRLRRVTVAVHGDAGGGAGVLWAPDL